MTQVTLKNTPCLGIWKGDETTIVKETTCGKYAVCALEGKVIRVIKLFTDKLHARRYNFAIHGDKLGE